MSSLQASWISFISRESNLPFQAKAVALEFVLCVLKVVSLAFCFWVFSFTHVVTFLLIGLENANLCILFPSTNGFVAMESYKTSINMFGNFFSSCFLLSTSFICVWHTFDATVYLIFLCVCVCIDLSRPLGSLKRWITLILATHGWWFSKKYSSSSIVPLTSLAAMCL